ncbi:CARDB domain-containing protein [Yoonia sediminilitoris]|nr:CARDB domain-containing protein [Yoonia sediminilitoris]
MLGMLLCSLFFASAVLAQTLEVEFAQGPFDEPRVRAAAFSVADWQQLSGQYGQAVRYVMVRYGDDEVWHEQTPQAPDRARALMAEAGYMDGFPTPAIIFHDQSTARLAVLIRRALSTIGVEASTQLVAPQDRAAAIAATQYNFGRERIEIPYIFLTTSRRTPPIERLNPVADLIAGRPLVRFNPDTRMLLVQVPVQNIGRGEAPPSTMALNDLSRRLRFANVRVPAIGPRSATQVEVTAPVPEAALGQELLLQAIVDPDERVLELNDQNNLSPTVPFTPPEPRPRPEPKPDLTVEWQRHAFDPQTGVLTVALVVRNSGAGNAKAHAVDIIDQDGARLARSAVPPLSPDSLFEASQTILVAERSLGRTIVLAAIVDSADQVDETNERNNQCRLQRIPIPAPEPEEEVFADLAVRISATSVQNDGRSVDVALEVVNTGARTSPSTSLTLRGDTDSEVIRLFVPSLRPGTSWSSTQTVVSRFRATGGAFELLARVDPDNLIPETNKANNRFVRTVMLPFPYLIWGGVGLAVILVLSMVFPRFRPGPKRPKAQRDSPPSPKTSLDYVPRPDPGFQQIDPDDAGGAVKLEVSLRAVTDAGQQTLIKEDA